MYFVFFVLLSLFLLSFMFIQRRSQHLRLVKIKWCAHHLLLLIIWIWYRKLTNNMKVKSSYKVFSKSLYSGLLSHERLVWHLLLQWNLTLKHLQLFDLQVTSYASSIVTFNETLSSLLHSDCLWTAVRRASSWSVETSVTCTCRSLSTHKSNWFLEYFLFSIPARTAIWYILLSQSIIIPMKFRWSYICIRHNVYYTYI